MVLQSKGLAKDAAETIMGASLCKGWRLVDLPFREAYPGGRQWNRNAAQFRLSARRPGARPDAAPSALGHDLRPHRRGTDARVARRWAGRKRRTSRQAAITSGPGLPAPSASPLSNCPTCFLWGSEKAGKSTLHEALGLLVTKGVVKADKALTSNNEFNGELAGAIICAVEEKDITLTPGAYARIKELTTARTIAIRQMRRDVYQVPNTTHWIQTSNKQSACPVISGDTRITVIQVGDLLEEQQVPKKKMEEYLKEEAPHFMYTLLNLPLPPCIDRLRLPMVVRPAKRRPSTRTRPLCNASSKNTVKRRKAL